MKPFYTDFGSTWTDNLGWTIRKASFATRETLAKLGVPMSETRGWTQLQAGQEIRRRRDPREALRRGGVRGAEITNGRKM